MRLVAHRHPAESEGVGRRKTSHEQLRALTLMEQTKSERWPNDAPDPQQTVVQLLSVEQRGAEALASKPGGRR